MSADEILIELEIKNIIVKIDSEYFITEEYKRLLELGKKPQVNLLDTPIAAKNTKVLGHIVVSEWPDEIALQTGRQQVLAFMNHCNVPTYSGKDSVYRIRGITVGLIKAIPYLINPEHYQKSIVEKVIQDYYTTVSAPKNFSNFIEKDFDQMYQEYLEGNIIVPPKNESDEPKDNTTWG